MSIPPTMIEDALNAHGNALVFYARQFFAGRSLHAAEDVVQEAFQRLSQQKNPPENVVGWLYTAVRNGAISAARSEKRRERRENQHEPPLFQPEKDAPFDAEKIALSLEKLDREQREIVALHIWNGLPFSEIATLLGKSKTTVFRRYEEALETLRQMLEE